MDNTNLIRAMVNPDHPSGPTGRGWKPGEQLEALRYYLRPDVRLIAAVKEHEHEGHALAILEHEGTTYLWHDTFGDDAMTDVLGGPSAHYGYQYILNTLRLGQARPYKSLDALVADLQVPPKSIENWSEHQFEPLLRALKWASPVRGIPVLVTRQKLESAPD